jgi:ATP-dependent DNA helicase RecQ
LTALELLEKHWKHATFREPQEAIINSVLEGNDTFALMPTGGGKSICFQIPALMKEGICLVISPLIALMKDQVAQLQQRTIKAIALTGGISQNEVSDLLDNCMYGNYKFLYIAPERLQQEWIVDRIKKLPVNLIAIDEAHCISQWGHDFRPSYLKIASLKMHFPKVPFIALTASANQRVQEDIINQLKLKNVQLFKKSFSRDNLAYLVIESEDKLYKINQILKKHSNPSIIYVRNRKSCLEYCNQLQTMGFKATYYHGGLSTKDRETNMQLWMKEEVQIMVATNAFGMGIDKANVKTVIHVQLPENLENYYQETGRAGRNGEQAFALLLTSPYDTIHAKNQFIEVLPEKQFLLSVYNKLCNYLQIAYGEGIDEVFHFNLNHFCTKYNFPILKTHNAFQFLDRQGILTLSNEFNKKIAIQFIIESKEVIRYMSIHSNEEEIILSILRNYSGVYDASTNINTALIANKSTTSEVNVLEVLENLAKKNIISYQANSSDSKIIFNEIREDEHTINRVSKFLESQNKLKKEQLETVLEYVSDKSECKNRFILSYFGETKNQDCGICSNCLKNKDLKKSIPSITSSVIELLKNQDLNSREIESMLNYSSHDVIFALQELLENKTIFILPNNSYSLAATIKK